MEINSSLAAKAYQQANTILGAPPQTEGANFREIFQGLSDTLTNHQTTAQAAMFGQVDPHTLVEALTSSQMAVDTVVAVRDKVVSAYQELMRMPV